MNFEQQHALPEAEAVLRMKILTERWKKHGLRVRWNENKALFHGRVKGFGFRGSIVVKDNLISGAAEISLVARRFGLRYVKNQIERYLDPSISIGSLRSGEI